jgi:hypothetical protein
MPPFYLHERFKNISRSQLSQSEARVSQKRVNETRDPKWEGRQSNFCFLENQDFQENQLLHV